MAATPSTMGGNSVNNNNLTASRAAGKSTKVRVKGGQLKTSIKDGSIVLTAFKGGFAGGQIDMAGEVYPSASDTAPQRLAVKFVNVSAAEVLRLVAPKLLQPAIDRLHLSGQLNGNWNGLTLSSILNSMSGNFDISLAGSTITDQVILEQLSKITGISDLSSMRFDSARVVGQAANGEISLTSINMAGPDFSVAGNGVVDLKANGMDVTFDVQVSQELAQKSSYYKIRNVMNLFKGEPRIETAELVRIPKFSLVGSLKQPEFRLNQPEIASVATPVNPDGANLEQVQTAAAKSPSRAKNLLRIAAAASGKNF